VIIRIRNVQADSTRACDTSEHFNRTARRQARSFTLELILFNAVATRKELFSAGVRIAATDWPHENRLVDLWVEIACFTQNVLRYNCSFNVSSRARLNLNLRRIIAAMREAAAVLIECIARSCAY
jgi:hypothetical protein